MTAKKKTTLPKTGKITRSGKGTLDPWASTRDMGSKAAAADPWAATRDMGTKQTVSAPVTSALNTAAKAAAQPVETQAKQTLSAAAKPTAAPKEAKAAEAPAPQPRTAPEDDLVGRLLKQAEERGSFTYDANDDPLYDAMADRYRRLGERAMEDTLGKTAALTGGYANSWAETVGAQAYADALSSLTEDTEDLRDSALAKYEAEGDDLLRRLSLALSREENTRSALADEADRALKAEESDRDWLTALLSIVPRDETGLAGALARRLAARKGV